MDRETAQGSDSEPARRTAAEHTSWGNRVSYEGKNYRLKDGVTAILFLGIDYGAETHAEGTVGGGGRSDAIMLLVLDDQDRSTTVFLIPRDTMANVDVYKENGDYAFSAFIQVNMQYSFGNSKKRSCYLTKRLLSEILFDLRIDYTLSLDAAGISSVAEQLGGLTLTLEEDYTDIDPSYQKGATITLDGKTAERFVRSRDTDVSGSGMARMNRHFELLKSLFSQYENKDSEKQLKDILNTAESYIESDLSADTITKLASYRLKDTAVILPGKLVSGEFHDEYYMDEEETKKVILELFYERVQ